MRRSTVFAALLAGCYHPSTERTCEVACPAGVCPNGMTCGGDGLCRSSPGDQCSVDAGDDDSANNVCVGQGLIKNFCFPRPAAAFNPAPGMLMTDVGNCSATQTQQNGTTLCYFIGTDVLITGTLRVIGPNPAVFVGVERVTVELGAIIDASSKFADVMPGAGGAEAKGCPLSAPGVSMPTVGGGGAGATFRGRGGNGGSGTAAAVTAPGGTSSAALVTVDAVRGGCPGGYGGTGSTTSGVRGFGGGAVYLVSNGTITIAGWINASGAGGGPGKASRGGGGGGGSGGFIGFDAPMYSIAATARVFAVGGSGASGANAMLDGGKGAEADRPAAPITTPGPAGAGSGGAGGGSGNGTTGGIGSDGGGGGGGGGTGFVGVTNMPTFPASTVAPMPTPML